MTIDTNIEALREMQAYRVNLLKGAIRLGNQQAALIRRHLGWSWELPKPERDKIKNKAAKLAQKFNRDGTYPGPGGLCVVLMAYKNSMEPLNIQRADIEKQMEALAKTLPAWEFVEAVSGFGALGLAQIVGEAGDLHRFPNPSKLWRWFGLAVDKGTAQGNPGPGATAEDWVDRGYNPKRRSVVWNIGASLIKAQVRNVKDDDGARTEDSVASGHYGQMYLDRKKYELGKLAEEAPKRRLIAERRAHRYMEKALLADLWFHWTGNARRAWQRPEAA